MSKEQTETLEQMRVRRYNESVGDRDKDDGYNCSICKNKGLIAHETGTGSEMFRDCKCMSIRNILLRARNSGLGDILHDLTFDRFVDTEPWQAEIKKKAKAFCMDGDAGWFYIGGQSGCGKSHICTAIVGHYIKAGKKVQYMLWAEDSKRLKQLASDTGYQKEIDKYKNAEVLYIDDFLKTRQGGSTSDADMNLAFEIINNRMLDNGKITIISSEKTLDELMDYDEATMSRIFQKTGNYKLNIAKDKGKNYRLLQA